MATNTDEVRSRARSRVRVLSRRLLVVVGFAAAGWAIGAGAAQAAAPDALGEVTEPVTDILGVSGSSGATGEPAADSADSAADSETTESTRSVADTDQGAEAAEEAVLDQAPAIDSEEIGATVPESDDAVMDAGIQDATPEPVSDVVESEESAQPEADTAEHGENAENSETEADAGGATEDSTSDADSGADPSDGLPLVGDVTDTASRTLDVQNAPAEAVRGVDGLLTTVVTPNSPRPRESDGTTETASSDDGSVTSALLRTAGGAVTGVTGTLRGAVDTLESSEVLRPVTEIGSGLTEVVRDTTGVDASRILGGVDTSLREVIDIPADLVDATYSTGPSVGQAPTPHVVSSPDSVARSADRAGHSQESQRNDVATSAPWSFTAHTLWADGQQGAAPGGSGTDGPDRGAQNAVAQGSGSATTSAGSSPVAAVGFLMNRVDLAADTGRRLPSTNGEVPVVTGAADDPSFSPD